MLTPIPQFFTAYMSFLYPKLLSFTFHSVAVLLRAAPHSPLTACPLQVSLPFLAAIDPRMPIRVITLSCLWPAGTFKSAAAKWWDVLSGLWHIYSARPGLYRASIGTLLLRRILRERHRLLECHTQHLAKEAKH